MEAEQHESAVAGPLQARKDAEQREGGIAGHFKAEMGAERPASAIAEQLEVKRSAEQLDSDNDVSQTESNVDTENLSQVFHQFAELAQQVSTSLRPYAKSINAAAATAELLEIEAHLDVLSCMPADPRCLEVNRPDLELVLCTFAQVADNLLGHVSNLRLQENDWYSEPLRPFRYKVGDAANAPMQDLVELHWLDDVRHIRRLLCLLGQSGPDINHAPNVRSEARISVLALWQRQIAVFGEQKRGTKRSPADYGSRALPCHIARLGTGSDTGSADKKLYSLLGRWASADGPEANATGPTAQRSSHSHQEGTLYFAPLEPDSRAHRISSELDGLTRTPRRQYIAHPSMPVAPLQRPLTGE